MDYSALATQLIRKMVRIMHSKPHRQMSEFSGGGMCILNHLMALERPALPGELSAHMGISSARIAAILNNLERKGLVSREIDASDRRKILVTITESGRAQVMGKRSRMHANMERILQELGEHDAKECLRIVDRITDIYEHHG